MTSVELCASMLRHAFFAAHTENRRFSEVEEALKFFFTSEEIAEARAVVTGRAALPTTGDVG